MFKVITEGRQRHCLRGTKCAKTCFIGGGVPQFVKERVEEVRGEAKCKGQVRSTRETMPVESVFEDEVTLAGGVRG